VLSMPTVIAQAAAKHDLGQRSGALAVDMESYSAGLVAAQRHLPFAVLRTIFDTADENIAFPVTTCLTPAGSLQPWRLLGYLVCHPGLWLQLPHWWRTAHVAGRHLQRWLQHFFLLLGQGAWYPVVRNGIVVGCVHRNQISYRLKGGSLCHPANSSWPNLLEPFGSSSVVVGVPCLQRRSLMSVLACMELPWLLA